MPLESRGGKDWGCGLTDLMEEETSELDLEGVVIHEEKWANSVYQKDITVLLWDYCMSKEPSVINSSFHMYFYFWQDSQELFTKKTVTFYFKTTDNPKMNSNSNSWSLSLPLKTQLIGRLLRSTELKQLVQLIDIK